jgi:Outer membrane protein beta-barrel domain
MNDVCRVATLVGATLLILVVPARVAAQGARVTELGVGYQLLHVEEETIGLGWFADISRDVATWKAVAGLVSGGYKHIEEHSTLGNSTIDVEGDLSIHAFMGGVRFLTRRNPRIVPFAQFLLGGIHGSASVSGTTSFAGQTTTVETSESSTEFGMMLGGGLNVALSDRVGLRVGGDYIRVFVERDANIARFTAGVVFPF